VLGFVQQRGKRRDGQTWWVLVAGEIDTTKVWSPGVGGGGGGCSLVLPER
jgi:hypothetical protein